MTVDVVSLALHAAQQGGHGCVLPPIQSRFDAKGRIIVTDDGLRIFLHRLIYQSTVGPIPANAYLLRTCDTFGCVAPWHHRISGRSYPPHATCPNGHPYPANPVIHGGFRRCAICYEARLASRRRGGEPNWRLQKQRQWCIHGHPLTPENTYRYPTPAGGERRKCRTCTIARRRGLDPEHVDVIAA